MHHKTLIALTTLVSSHVMADSFVIERLEPANWWAGMQHPELQLMLYGKDIAQLQPQVQYDGVTLNGVSRTNNPNYLFVNLTLADNVKPGDITLHFSHNGETVLSHNYPLLQRRDNSAKRQGFNPADVIYLLAPDRFANGNPANGNMPGMLEQANRQDDSGRHGGDIARGPAVPIRATSGQPGGGCMSASSKREPWHYDAFEGRPDWSKDLGRQRAISHQRQNMERRRASAGANIRKVAKHEQA